MKQNFTLHRLANCILFIVTVVYVTGCKKNVDEYALHASQSSQATEQTHFRNGTIIINEGWPSHTKGSVNWWQTTNGSPYGITPNIYAQQNPGKQLGTATEYGAVWNENLYIVSKQGPLVVTDAITLIETARLTSLPASGRAFLGLTSALGLISTTNGVYKLNLNPLSIGDRIDGVTGQTGIMLQAGNYIFIMSENRGMIVLNKNTFSIVKTIGGPTEGITETPNGNVWAAGDSILYKIDTSSLLVTKIPLPFAATNAWANWNAGAITASTRQNAIYIVKRDSSEGGTLLYKYIVGNPSTLLAPFGSAPANYEFYGSMCFSGGGVLLASVVHSGGGTNYQDNKLLIFDASGEGSGGVSYTGYYFPAFLISVHNGSR